MKFNKNRNIIDATAGLGYDSFILASLGAKVTLIERSQKMHELLQNGINEGISFGGEIEKIINWNYYLGILKIFYQNLHQK